MTPDDDRTRSDEDVLDQKDYPDGDSRTTNPSAPPSAGSPHGEHGVVDTNPGGPDLRPVVPEEEEPVAGTGETPVPSPSGGADAGGGTDTASSGTSGSIAGPEDEGEGRG